MAGAAGGGHRPGKTMCLPAEGAARGGNSLGKPCASRRPASLHSQRHRAPPLNDRAVRRCSTSEGSPAVRDRTAVAVPRARYEVILVSRAVRCPLRGRYRMPATPA
ncbi:hypothetical protein GCM10018783_11830 [Streptomyces griseosporeus]|nr:hypothetical protein GCM10018783_11830 [Streptomyces griseosporeus]